MAQEREKRRIVIASILKPTDDTRMTEKMGHTLARSGYEVTIIGFAPSAETTESGSLRTISLGRFPRLSVRRWFAKWKVFNHTYALDPKVFIFSTYELLLPAIILKIIRNTRIIYDVRENYYRNILHSEGLPSYARALLAVLVRFQEKLTAPAVDYFFLAERGYEQEFKFYRGGWTVVENKALAVAGSQLPVDRNSNRPNFIFTGTLSESTGVFRVIRLAKALHHLNPEVVLTIAGYAASLDVQKRIRQEASSSGFIHLVGVDSLVPHAQILELIKKSDAGFIASQRMPHTVNMVPTKLFEYLQASLPIVTENHWPWVSRFVGSQPFILCDLDRPDPEAILKALKTNSFYTAPVLDAGWESEEPKLLEAIKNIV